jgi:hypothetical protein
MPKVFEASHFVHADLLFADLAAGDVLAVEKDGGRPYHTSCPIGTVCRCVHGVRGI